MAKEGQARESKFDNAEQRKADAELAANPPKIVWEKVRGTGGIWVGRLIKEGGPPAAASKKRRGPRPPCACAVYGSPRRRPGPQHDEGCARREPW